MSRKIPVVGSVGVVVLVLFMMCSSVVDARATKTILQDFMSDLPANDNNGYAVEETYPLQVDIVDLLEKLLILFIRTLAYIAAWITVNFFPGSL